MIVNAITSLIYSILYIVTSPMRLFDDVTLDSFNADISGAITAINGSLSPIDIVFPIFLIVILFGVLVTFETYYIFFKGINWIIRKIPGIS